MLTVLNYSLKNRNYLMCKWRLIKCDKLALNYLICLIIKLFFYYYFFIIIILFLFFFLKNFLTVFNNFFIFDISFFGIIDNYYECISNLITNDLFGFSISYFLINGIEFTFIGFLLLLGSVICVNLFQLNKNVGVNNYTNFLTIFNFFLDFSNFLFLRKQNLLKQGNIKSSIKIFKKK